MNPRDHRHEDAMRLLKELEGLIVADTAVLEFQVVLRARGRSLSQIRMALLTLHEAFEQANAQEAKTIGTSLLALQGDLEERFGLSYFDSLVVASAFALDRQIVSDDSAFDGVPDLKRIPLSERKPR